MYSQRFALEKLEEENHGKNSDSYGNTHTNTHLSALFFRTTRVSLYQKDKTNLDFTEAKRR